MNRTLTICNILLLPVLFLSACASPAAAQPQAAAPLSEQTFPTPAAVFTPLPTRAPFEPGQLVDYTAQTGDTLPALAARFNTTEAEILTANPVIPKDAATTMPPGFPMKIPIYYKALWGTPYQILPDSLFVNGPAQAGFDIDAYVNSQPGWLKTYTEQIADGPHSGADLVRLVSQNFSVSPRLLLAMLEYHAGALTKPAVPDTTYVLNYNNPAYHGVYLQLVWMANTLNNGYYAWRRGALLEFEHPDSRIERPDPWQNAATVAIQYAFSRLYSAPLYDQMIGPGGLAQTYTTLFGNPWDNLQPHIPGSLQQPAFLLPFENGKPWNYTGGPHTGWGKGEPYAAIDFAPTGVSECNATTEWVTAIADGIVARSDTGEILFDLDGDGDERTGWVILYLHLATVGRPKVGQTFKSGDRLGHPSCEGGEATGTHVHIARKYNGEWILADSPIPFNLDGWVTHDGANAYKGTLTRFSQTVTASNKAEMKSLIRRGE